jgi:hypothetical protein
MTADITLYGIHYGSVMLMPIIPEASYPLLRIHIITGTMIDIKQKIPEVPNL